MKSNKQDIVDCMQNYKLIIISLKFLLLINLNTILHFLVIIKDISFSKNLKERKHIIASNIKDEMGSKQLIFDYFKLMFLNGTLYDNYTICY